MIAKSVEAFRSMFVYKQCHCVGSVLCFVARFFLSKLDSLTRRQNAVA